MNREQAITAAVSLLSQEDHRHGIFLAARRTSGEPAAGWEIEFAYEGLEGPCPATEPPAILILVDPATQEARFAPVLEDA